jgi:hypothetical protein
VVAPTEAARKGADREERAKGGGAAEVGVAHHGPGLADREGQVDGVELAQPGGGDQRVECDAARCQFEWLGDDHGWFHQDGGGALTTTLPGTKPPARRRRSAGAS